MSEEMAQDAPSDINPEEINPLGEASTDMSAPSIAGASDKSSIQDDFDLSTHEDKDELENFFDVPLEVSAELGRLTVCIRELLSLDVGSVLELDKLAGEPLEILVNGKLICRGEVLVINEKYGVRMTDIVSPHEDVDNRSKMTNG